MSPAATRRYVVRFTDWTLYETVVLASNKREALAKAIALYNANGLLDFTTNVSGVDGWEAEFLGMEVQS
ncbi:hypothetical protein [Bradyrhizobium sp. sGM-13]|uniref:hypothetical protein n=1 Tax=Bradyrhizobium sp. sGM-13 TaxID=2831781 RepID=UPI001BCA7936|nr:hypothetical protein [Bradyrhizobium sp. sGM-13]